MISVETIIVNKNYEQLKKDWIAMSEWVPYEYY